MARSASLTFRFRPSNQSNSTRDTAVKSTVSPGTRYRKHHSRVQAGTARSKSGTPTTSKHSCQCLPARVPTASDGNPRRTQSSRRRAATVKSLCGRYSGYAHVSTAATSSPLFPTDQHQGISAATLPTRFSAYPSTWPSTEVVIPASPFTQPLRQPKP